MRPSPLFQALDVNGDGVISAAEIKNACPALLKLDKNGDGQLTADEVRPNFRPGGSPNEHQNGSEKPAHAEACREIRSRKECKACFTAEILTTMACSPETKFKSWHPTPGREGEGRRPDFARVDALFNTLDSNHDGTISSAEVSNAAASLLKLDKNGDGQLTMDELRGPHGGGEHPKEDHEL